MPNKRTKKGTNEIKVCLLGETVLWIKVGKSRAYRNEKQDFLYILFREKTFKMS